MPDKCRVNGCMTVSSKNNKYALFRVPDDITLKNEWKKFLNLSVHAYLPSTTKICARHFHSTYIKKNKQRPRLSRSAVPTLNPAVVKNTSSVAVHVTETQEENVSANYTCNSGTSVPAIGSVNVQFEFVNCAVVPETIKAVSVDDVSFVEDTNHDLSQDPSGDPLLISKDEPLLISKEEQ